MKIAVTSRRHTAYARRGTPFEVDLTPGVQVLIDRGIYIPVEAPEPDLSEATRAELVERAEAMGIKVAKSWTKATILDAILTEEDHEANGSVADAPENAPQSPPEPSEASQDPDDAPDAADEPADPFLDPSEGDDPDE